MKQWTALDVDEKNEVGYIRYRPLRDGEIVARTKRLSEDVVADFDDLGAVLGIELLGLGPAALEKARDFASGEGLAFPKTLAKPHSA
jgi:uncharacterized protein YuzE